MKEFVTQFDTALKDWFEEKRNTYQIGQTADPVFFELFDSVAAIALAGGKRVRPYMAWLMYQAAGGQSIQDYRPFIALELFHVFCLVHDDIMDGGDSRRGVPTVHRAITDTRYQGNAKVGESQAILMGDMVFSWCHQLLDESGSSKEVKALFAKMQEAVIIGQMIDVDVTTEGRVTMDRITQKMKLKTASYTFVYPMQIGVALVDSESRLMDFCDAFGTALGLGFQIQDDLLDLLADASVSKKTPMRDIAEGQHTYITQHVFDCGSEGDVALLEQYFAKAVSTSSIEQLRTMFAQSGAIAFARQAAAEQFDTAKQLLQEQPLEDSVRTALYDGILYLESRGE